MERKGLRRVTSISLCCLWIAVCLVDDPLLLVTAQEVEDELEFSYDPESENGPAHWGDIRPEWALCGNGTKQSPIDLLSKPVQVVSDLGILQQNYRPAEATLVNRGHDIMVRWEEDAGELVLNGTKYKLRQCHWHSPSEHIISRTGFALELHLVHNNTWTGDVAVVGIIYNIGPPDPFLFQLREALEELSGAVEEEKGVGVIDPNQILLRGPEYYRYDGSLTTPRCAEGVTWTVMREIGTASAEQVRLLREAVHDNANQNARPIQPLNGRSVKLFKPKHPQELLQSQ